ncbi:hypothetical protein MTR_3g452610 [Medicago truncatula]|uniref:Uncharacterized protein n=1 Tax=Medicago truncatula TaxID=3880 RepID=A0A072UVB4_MEDTR|nr:hypothetical protein MTR_3g452610 [Medicago truncatula]
MKKTSKTKSLLSFRCRSNKLSSPPPRSPPLTLEITSSPSENRLKPVVLDYGCGLTGSVEVKVAELRMAIEVTKRRWNMCIVVSKNVYFKPFNPRPGIYFCHVSLIYALNRETKQCSGVSGCTLRTIVLFQRSSKNKHPMPSNPFELAVASLFWSSAMLGVIKSFEQPLKL